MSHSPHHPPSVEAGTGHPAARPSEHEHQHVHADRMHDKHAGHSVAMFRDKFWISLALTIPTLIWGHMLPRLFGYTPPHLPGAAWIPPLLRHRGVRLRRLALPAGRRARDRAIGCRE